MEIGGMMAEQNAILNISHSRPLWIKTNYVIEPKPKEKVLELVLGDFIIIR